MIGVKLITINKKLSLINCKDKFISPVCVDFTSKQMINRLQVYKNNNELIIQAIGKGKKNIIDATAGLCRDSFILASFGHNVQMIEISNVISRLIKDGLNRGSKIIRITKIINRMKLINCDSNIHLRSLKKINYPDIIYIDLMFPGVNKKKLQKKNIQMMKNIPADNFRYNSRKALSLINLSIKIAKDKVVVKSHKDCKVKNKYNLFGQITGKKIRFDIYKKIKY